MDTWITQFRRGLLELGLLALLQEQENYGYGLVEALNELPGFEVTESTVYPILARLATDGLLDVRKQPSPAGPPRRYYHLNSLGRERLQEMQNHWQIMTTSLDRVLKKKGLTT